MHISQLPRMWLYEEIKLQKIRLKALQQADTFRNLPGYKELIKLRKDFITQGEVHLKRIETEFKDDLN